MIILPALIEKISTRKDNTLVVNIATNEMSPSKVGMLMSLHNKMGYVAINDEKFTGKQEEAISGLKSDTKIGKTPSQRLRAVLYLVWKSNKEGFETSDTHYEHYLEKVIEHYKTKID